jgi:hypothetical protein
MDNQGILGGKVFASVSPAKGNPTAQFTPVTIASLVNAPGNAPQAKVILNGGQSTFGYTNNAVFFPPNPVNNLVDAQLDGASLNVIDPTIASSAAVAGYAAPNSWNSLLPGSILSPLHNELAYFARDLSPLAQVQGGAFKMPRSLPSSSNLYSAFTNISGGGYTRVADGGYVDNMSAAYMLRNIQDKYGAQDPVHLTIFANKSEDPVTGVKMLIAPDGQKSAYGIADDVAELFGNMYGNNSDGDTVGYDGFGLKLNTLSSKIFDPVAWYGKEKPDWNYNSGNVDISYFKLDAKTVDNAAFGVKGGQAVNLGIFVASNSKSGAAPILSSYLDSYDANYDVYRQAISDPVLGGYAYIKDAFGILA